jgi:hypothetical protein
MFRFILAVMTWLVLLSSVSLPSFALTPEEVLQLKAAGVSEETIQLMLETERDRKLSPSLLEQEYATERMGTWHLRDGRTIHSTGKRQLPLHYPTEYPPISPYPSLYIAPHVSSPY